MRFFQLDVARAVAIYMMTINHVYPTLLSMFTLRELALSDGAELLILASGVAAGLTLARRVDARGWKILIARVARRTGILYLASLGITLGLVLEHLIIVSTGVTVSTSAVKSDLPTWQEILFLTHAQGNVLILRTYVFLSVLSPVILFLLRWKVAWTLVLSFALYLAMQLWFWIADEPLGGGQLLFWIPSWQFLFTLAFCFGFRGCPPLPKWTVWAAVLCLQFGLLVRTETIPIDLWSFVHKPSLGPLRLISGLATGVLVWRFIPRQLTMVGNWKGIVDFIVSPGRCPLFAFVVSELVVVGAEELSALAGYSTIAQVFFPLAAAIFVMLSSACFLRYRELSAAGEKRPVADTESGMLT